MRHRLDRRPQRGARARRRGRRPAAGRRRPARPGRARRARLPGGRDRRALARGRPPAALAAQLATLPRREIARVALAEHGAVVLVEDRDRMVEAANEYAPEHLELLVQEPGELVDRIDGAGAIFVGAHTPEAAGDYTAGPSHVLPTAGAARYASPLGVWDFIKYTSVLELSPSALRAQAAAITALARAEGLEAHARAVELRIAEDAS
ncbi:MAG: histidinol dehydrogenase [Nannocystaceae bacterium]